MIRNPRICHDPIQDTPGGIQVQCQQVSDVAIPRLHESVE